MQSTQRDIGLVILPEHALWLLRQTDIAQVGLMAQLSASCSHRAAFATAHARRFSSSYLVDEMTWNNPHATDMHSGSAIYCGSGQVLLVCALNGTTNQCCSLPHECLKEGGTMSFQLEKGSACDRQQIQMGIRSSICRPNYPRWRTGFPLAQ